MTEDNSSIEGAQDDDEEDGASESEIRNAGFNVTLINTNVRSICPKVNSLVECLDEVDAAFGVITETWLSDGDGLQEKLDDLSAGSGLGLITKNRPVNQMGFSHGGVAIVYRESACTFKEICLPNPGSFEVVVAAARFPGYSRQLVVIGCYLPPTYTLSLIHI